jgi:hypothetical protein
LLFDVWRSLSDASARSASSWLAASSDTCTKTLTGTASALPPSLGRLARFRVTASGSEDCLRFGSKRSAVAGETLTAAACSARMADTSGVAFAIIRSFGWTLGYGCLATVSFTLASPRRMDSLPVRGAPVRRLQLPLPPGRMPLLRARRPLKRWRYVGVYRPDVMLCVAAAQVGGVPQRWWAVALPDGTISQGRRGVTLRPGGIRAAGVIDLEFEETDGVEVVSPHGRSYVWTRKQAPVNVRGTVRAGGRTFEIEGDDGFIDDSAGYHARHTAWRWSAGVGRTGDGRRVAWNLVDGVHDGVASERTVWVDGEPHEVIRQEFAADLSRVGELSFREWSARESRLNLLVMRNRYRQPFGEFSGELPGGFTLAEGYGVMEEHDVLW